MRITVITLFPDMVRTFLDESIIKRAQKKAVVSIEYVNLRDFARDAYGTVDGKPYGGGVGMVLRVDIVHAALKSIGADMRTAGTNRILTSARAAVFTQQKAEQLRVYDHLVFLCGHYEGFDERVASYVDEELSLGDFVLTGGEIATAAMIDAVVRLIPGALDKPDAVEQESFFSVPIAELLAAGVQDNLLTQLKECGVTSIRLLEYPQYTRPEQFENSRVPDILLSGYHAEIHKWRLNQAYTRTKQLRPDLFQNVV